MKSTVIVDANVILRYLVRDEPEQGRLAEEFLATVRTGEIEAFIPDAVVAECAYLLEGPYRVPRSEVVFGLERLMSYKGVSEENRGRLICALRIYADKRIDFVDALLLALSEEKGWPVFSFDRDLRGARQWRHA